MLKEKSNLDAQLGKDTGPLGLSATITALKIMSAIVDGISAVVGTLAKIVSVIGLIPVCTPVCGAILIVLATILLHAKIVSTGIKGMLTAANSMLQLMNDNPTLYNHLRTNTAKSGFEFLAGASEIGIVTAWRQGMVTGTGDMKDYLTAEQTELEGAKFGNSKFNHNVGEITTSSAANLGTSIGGGVYTDSRKDDFKTKRKVDAEEGISELQKEAFESLARKYAKDKTEVSKTPTKKVDESAPKPADKEEQKEADKIGPVKDVIDVNDKVIKAAKK